MSIGLSLTDSQFDAMEAWLEKARKDGGIPTIEELGRAAAERADELDGKSEEQVVKPTAPITSTTESELLNMLKLMVAAQRRATTAEALDGLADMAEALITKITNGVPR